MNNSIENDEDLDESSESIDSFNIFLKRNVKLMEKKRGKISPDLLENKLLYKVNINFFIIFKILVRACQQKISIFKIWF